MKWRDELKDWIIYFKRMSYSKYMDFPLNVGDLSKEDYDNISNTLDDMIRCRKVFPVPTKEDRQRHLKREIDIFNSPDFIYPRQYEVKWRYWQRIYQFYEEHNLNYDELDKKTQSIIMNCLHHRCKVEKGCYAIEKDLQRYLKKEITFEEIRDRFGEMQDLFKGVNGSVNLEDYTISSDRYGNPVYDEEKIETLKKLQQSEFNE